MPGLAPLIPILLRLASEPATSAPLNTSLIRQLLALTSRYGRRPHTLQRAILYRTLSNKSQPNNSYDNDIMTTITTKPEKLGINQWPGPNIILFAERTKHPSILNLEDLSFITINHVKAPNKQEWHLSNQTTRQALLYKFITLQQERNTDLTRPQCKLVISSTSTKLLLATAIKATAPDHHPIDIHNLIEELKKINVISTQEASDLSQQFFASKGRQKASSSTSAGRPALHR